MDTCRATKGTTHKIVMVLRDSVGDLADGLSVTIRVRRASDGAYLQSDASWDSAPSSDPAAVETDSTDFPGVYHYDFALPDQIDRYTVRIDGSATASPRYLFGALMAVSDGDGDVKLARAMLTNKQQQAIATGVVTVMDDDGVTPLLTLTPSVDDVANPTLNILTPS